MAGLLGPLQLPTRFSQMSKLGCHLLLWWLSVCLALSHAADNSTDDILSTQKARSAEEEDETAKPENLPPGDWMMGFLSFMSFLHQFSAS